MKGILAILIAGIMVAAMIAPAMGTDTGANVNDVASTYDCSATAITAQPVPGSSAGEVNYSMTVTDNNGGDTVPNGVWTAVVDFGEGAQNTTLTAEAASGLTRTIIGTDSVPANTTAGDYTVTFKLDGTQVCTKVVTVGEVLAISVTSMNFGGVNPGDNNKAGKHVVTNTGNVNVKFVDEAPAGYDNNATDGITWDNMAGSGTAAGESIADTQLTTTWTAATEIAVSGSADVNFELDVPLGLKAGSYAGSTTFTATKA